MQDWTRWCELEFLSRCAKLQVAKWRKVHQAVVAHGVPSKWCIGRQLKFGSWAGRSRSQATTSRTQSGHRSRSNHECRSGPFSGQPFVIMDMTGINGSNGSNFTSGATSTLRTPAATFMMTTDRGDHPNWWFLNLWSFRWWFGGRRWSWPTTMTVATGKFRRN